MPDFITVGRKLVPTNHIAFIEPFDPNANPDFQTSRDFKARVVLVNRRESLLTEDTPQAFAEANGFHILPTDGIAINPAIPYRVEAFVPGAAITPTKPFATRLVWRDLDGNDQSKLLITPPETVLAVVVRGRPSPSRRPVIT